ncbi:MAG: hypothetical protein ACJ8EL_02200 [Rhizomicrobium sp.]
MENLKPVELNADEILAVSGGGSISNSGNNSDNTLNGSGNDNSIVIGNGVYIVKKKHSW